MNIYLLDDPATPAVFARFSSTGTWTNEGTCPACKENPSRLTEPLQIDWNPGTDVIGDFSWRGSTCVVTERARSVLEAEGFECTFGRVEVLPPWGRSKRKRVPYPYTGPPIDWMRPTCRVPLNEEKSGVGIEIDCSDCGQRRYTFKREGIVIDRRAWSGEKMFLIDQFGKSKTTFLTEPALAILERHKLTNLCPRPAGVIAES